MPTSGLVLRILWALFGVFIVFCGVYLTVEGFRGNLPAFYTGLGWACASLGFLGSALEGIVKALGAVVEKLGNQ